MCLVGRLTLLYSIMSPDQLILGQKVEGKGHKRDGLVKGSQNAKHIAGDRVAGVSLRLY